MISKRFPADMTLKETTFLNDKKVDAELYAYLQAISRNENGVTVIEKCDLQKQSDICDIIGVKSAKTYRVHMRYLIENGYVIDEGMRFVLPHVEDIYLLLPLKTIRFLQDVFKDQVVKAYIYLGQKWKNSEDKSFTYAELADHVGVKLSGNSKGYDLIRNMLIALQRCGLIQVSKEFFVGKGMSRHTLLDWTDEAPLR